MINGAGTSNLGLRSPTPSNMTRSPAATCVCAAHGDVPAWCGLQLSGNALNMLSWVSHRSAGAL